MPAVDVSARLKDLSHMSDDELERALHILTDRELLILVVQRLTRLERAFAPVEKEVLEWKAQMRLGIAAGGGAFALAGLAIAAHAAGWL